MSKVYGVLPETPVPLAPADLAADEVTAGYVSLSWTDDGNGTSWTVYRDGASLGNVAAQSYTDSTVAPSTAYSFQVQASNSAGSSALSAVLAVTTTANSLPVWELPDQSGVIGQSFTLDLNSVCTDNDGHAIAYTLVSGTVPGLTRTGSSYAGTPSTAGVYPLTFRASDGYGTSDVTINFTVTDPDVTAPTVPTGVSASVSGSTVTVTWAASTDATGIAQYRVFRNGVFRFATALTTYTETGVGPGSYSYTVSAVDTSANANESAQSTASNTVVIAAAGPDNPTSFEVVAVSSSQINLSWSPGLSGPAPDDYDVDFSTVSNTGPWTALSIGLVTTYSHTSLSASTRYWYRVRANLAGVASPGYAQTNTTTLAPGQSKRWNPGHYIKTQGSETNPNQAAYWTGVFNDMDRAATFAPMRGSFVTVAWGSFNTTGSTYDWTALNALFAKADSLGQKLIIAISYKGFEVASPGLCCPVDLRATHTYPTYKLVAGALVQKGWITAVWRASVMNRFIAAVQAFATQYGGRAALESVSWSESAPSFSTSTPPSDYSNSALSTQLQALTVAAVPMFPTSWAHCCINSLSGQVTQMLNAAHTAGAGFSTPDADDTNAIRLFRGETVSGEQAPTHGDLRGKMLHEEIASSPVLGGKDDNGPPSNIINWSQTNDVTHLCWVTSVTLAGHTWADIQAAINADPLLHSAYPTG